MPSRQWRTWQRCCWSRCDGVDGGDECVMQDRNVVGRRRVRRSMWVEGVEEATASLANSNVRELFVFARLGERETGSGKCASRRRSSRAEKKLALHTSLTETERRSPSRTNTRRQVSTVTVTGRQSQLQLVRNFGPVGLAFSALPLFLLQAAPLFRRNYAHTLAQHLYSNVNSNL